MKTKGLDLRARLRAGNELFCKGDPARRIDTALNGQHPYAIVVCCSDSRVIPEQIFSADIGDLFDTCMARANDAVVKAGREQPENRGMATTLVLCHVREDKAYFANVGDSRAYLYADGQLLQITEDHSYVNALIRMGVLTEEEARHHKRGHVITKAIGAELTVEGDQYDVEIREGDILLLCTDGLYGELSKEEMIEILQDDQDMQILTERLVDRANEHGGRDNITAITVKVQGGNQNEQ